MFTKTRYFNPSFINTIEKDETYHGHWWLPDRPDEPVSGVLYLRKEGGLRLHLIGMFPSDSSETLGHRFANHDIILGELLPGRQAVTLIDCKERQRQSPYLSNVADAAVQRFNAEYLVFSLHLKQAPDLKFSDFQDKL